MTAPAEAREADVDAVAEIIQGRYRIGERFTQNDLRTLIGEAGMQCTSHGTGAIFQHLKRRGVIRKTGHYVQSTNPQSRGNTLAIWARRS